MTSTLRLLTATALAAATLGAPAFGSSHMDAPLITFDDPANTTDVYAFVTADPQTGRQYLTAALSVYPFEEPGIGPNNYRFDDRVAYDIHIALDGNIARGVPDITYRFRFDTTFKAGTTILQNYLGPIDPNQREGEFYTNQNMRQTFTLREIDRRGTGQPVVTVIGTGAVPPNNQGLVTRFYNTNNDGDRLAKRGVDDPARLDPYTRNAIYRFPGNFIAFAGQRDDGFYADIQSIFDLDFSFGTNTGSPDKPFDSQGGFNVHTIVLSIPLSKFRGADIAGVYATTSRAQGPNGTAPFVQVGRQGNPLFAEALIANADKDRYNQSEPKDDAANFAQYAANPELAAVLGTTELIPGLLSQIFIPDLIKVDLSTGPARLAGDPGFSERSIFGGDLLQSTVQDPFGNGGLIPGGWPNGRRFGDDVIDIALIALGVAGPGPDFSGFAGDRVSKNDITYNQVFPYAATPHNGRRHPDQLRPPAGL
jgi:hypothetical protein